MLRMSFSTDFYLIPVLKSIGPNVKNVKVRKTTENFRNTRVMTLIYCSNTEGKFNTDMIIFQALNITGL